MLGHALTQRELWRPALDALRLSLDRREVAEVRGQYEKLARLPPAGLCDDRFTAAIDRATDSKSVFTVAYVVRAVSPGNYVLPQPYVEDMYNPSRYGRTSTDTAEVRGAK